MKVVMGIPDSEGCGFYRVKAPGAAVRAMGHDIMQSESLNVRVEKGHVVDVEIDADVDILLMQRPLRRWSYEMIKPVQAKGIAVVVDIDDDFSCVDPTHFGYANFQPQTSPESNRVWLARAAAMADLVTVTTPALARRYGHGRVAVLPNCIPEGMLPIGDLVRSDVLTFGWPGHVGSHPHDPHVIGNGAAKAQDETGARFLHIGSGDLFDILRLNGEYKQTGNVELGDYPYAVAQLDAGLVPLADTAFNEAKSCLKGLEMAALGVPFVASPTADYLRLAAEGIGVTAKNRGRSWASAIKRMLGPEGKERAVEAKAIVAEKHTYELNGWRWAEAWEQAIQNRRTAHVQRAA